MGIEMDKSRNGCDKDTTTFCETSSHEKTKEKNTSLKASSLVLERKERQRINSSLHVILDHLQQIPIIACILHFNFGRYIETNATLF